MRRFVFPNLFIWVRRKIPSRKCSIKATAIWMHSIDFLKKDVLKKRKEKIWCILAFQKFSQFKSSWTCSFFPRKSKLAMNRVYQPHYYCDNCDPDASDQLLYFYAIQYGLHVLMFFLNCIVDVKPKKYDERIRVLKNPCPKLEAAYFSRLFYFWCDSLLWLGFRKPLVTTDLWDMDPVVTSR